MNKIYTFLAVLFLFPIWMQAQDQTFSLTTSKSTGETLSFTVNRTLQDLTVDWGDGNEVTYTTESAPLREITGTLMGQTITVKGSQYLNTLICEGQGLTAVNFTSAPNLQSLYLSHNELSTLTLRAIGENLLDLDCSHNSLRSLSLTVSNYPNVETLNISDNNIGSISGSSSVTNYVGTFANLQYLNISNNERIKQAVVSSNTQLDYLDCSGNVLTRLTLPAEGRLTVIDAANNNLTTLDPTPFSTLLQMDVTGNQLTTLDLTGTRVIKDLFAADNELTSISFTTRATRDTLNICDVRNNMVHFNGLPRSNSKVRYLNVYPQRPFKLTADMGFNTYSWEENGETKTVPYVVQNPSYETRTSEDYIVDLTYVRTDGNGATRNVLTFYNGDTALEQYRVTAASGDYTVTGNNYTFLTSLTPIVIRLTHTNGFYKNYTFESEPFYVNDPATTAIGRITMDGTAKDNAVYDLQGRRVANPSSGIYIVGGKKVYIK